MGYRRISSLIPERIDELKSIKKKCSRNRKIVPEGSLKVINNKGSFQYYYRKKNECNGTYIRKKDTAEFRKKVVELAENEYIKQVIESVDNEIALLKNLQALYAEDVFEQVYDSMNEGKQRVIAPVVLTDEEYIKQWLNTVYEKNEYFEEQKTLGTSRGEFVRSKSEQHIANMLYSMGIPYFYEKPLILIDKNGREQKVFPDFTILDVRNRREIIWEHFGVMDNEMYRENAVWKTELYMMNGYTVSDKMIITMETRGNPFDVSTVENMLRERFVQ